MASSNECTPLSTSTSFLITSKCSDGSSNYGGSFRGNGCDDDKDSSSSSATMQRYWIAAILGLLVGAVISTVAILRSRSVGYAPQEIIVNEHPVPIAGVAEASASSTSTTSSTTATAGAVVVEEIVPSHRPVCQYYNVNGKASAAQPRILQTSMLEPSKPWSVKPCLLAQDPSQVVLNAFSAPDAILQVNFTYELSNESVVNPNKPILGFGGAFTEASALNFHRLQPAGQEAVLELLFGKTGLGYSVGRIPIHSCDFSTRSYNFDNEDGDFELEHFDTDVQHDVDNGMIDFAQRALEKFRQSWGVQDIDATIVESAQEDDDNSTTFTTDTTTSSTLATDERFRLYASPWSPPAWMKRPTWADPKHAEHSNYMNGSATPNCIRDGVGPHSKYAAAWALYFSKYITAYQEKHNLQLWAVTVQNEPEFPAPWEACAYTPANMTDFVAYHLGPTLQRDHPQIKILGFDHNKDHINHWAMTMLNGTDGDPNSTVVESSAIASQYLAGTAYHWYAGGMDRLLDGSLGISNLHRLQENLVKIGRQNNHILLGSEACHCPSTGYAGGDINVYWDRAERYAHTILADLAAGSRGWVEWNLILDAIGGPNHLGNLCESTLLAVPHRALDAAAHSVSPLPDFEHSKPFGNLITGDNRTREELNALGFLAKYLDLGVAVQPMFYYMGHISRHVRPGSVSVPGLVEQNLGQGEIFKTAYQSVAGGGENDLARDGIELLLWPCEGSTRQIFELNHDFSKHLVVRGHDWLGSPTKSCIGNQVDPDMLGLRLGSCDPELGSPGEFDAIPIPDDEHGRYTVRLLNHPKHDAKLCLGVRKLRNGGGSYGPRGGAQVALTHHCKDNESAKWKVDMVAGTISSLYFQIDVSEKNNEVCMTTGWPFLQMGAFLTPNGDAAKTVVILNEAKDSANYALKNDNNVLLTGSIPPRSIQTVLLD